MLVSPCWACVCIHACACVNWVCVCVCGPGKMQRWRWQERRCWATIRWGTRRPQSKGSWSLQCQRWSQWHHALPLWLPVHLLPELFHIFPRYLKPLPVQHAWWWWAANWWMWKFTEGPKVSTQVHWDPREDALSMIDLPRVRSGSEGPGQSQTQWTTGVRGMAGPTEGWF